MQNSTCSDLPLPTNKDKTGSPYNPHIFSLRDAFLRTYPHPLTPHTNPLVHLDVLRINAAISEPAMTTLVDALALLEHAFPIVRAGECVPVPLLVHSRDRTQPFAGL